MKKVLFIVVMLAVLISMAVAEECLSLPTLVASEVPFQYDPNGGLSRIIRWEEHHALMDICMPIMGCDPDGDPFFIEALFLPLGAFYENGNVIWKPKQNQVGVYYLSFRITDIPPEGTTALVNEASYIVRILPRLNKKPHFKK